MAVSSHTLLIVDDSESARYYLRKILEPAGYPVIEAATGRQALELAEELSPSLIVMDIGLPDLDGYEVCRRIRANPRTSRTLVLQTSARFNHGSASFHGMEGGSDGFLVQPIDPQVMLATIRALLRIRESEEALQESNLRFRELANMIPQLAWMANAQGSAEYLNDRWVDYTGWSLDALLGDGWNELIHPDDRERTRKRWKHALESGEQYEVEYRLRDREKAYHWFITRGHPVRDTQGKIIRWFGTCTEIEDQKRAQQDLENALRAREQALETLALVNHVGESLTAELQLEKIVQKVTDAGTKLSGAQFGAFFYNVVNEAGESYTLYAISGVPREMFSRFPMPRNTGVFNPTFTGAGSVRSDDIRKDPRYGKNAPYHGMPPGHLPVVSYLAVPVVSREGEVLGGLFFGHEKPAVFTEQVQKIVEGLASQAAIAMDNAKLYAKVQESVRSRDTFLSIASHELKTPLTSMKLQLQTTQRQIQVRGENEALAPTRTKRLVEQMSRQVERLSRLVDDMLDISRIATGKLTLQYETVDLGALAQEIVDRLAPVLAQASCTLRLNAAESVIGRWDRYRIEQVIINLLTNAARYGAGKPIEVEVGVQQNQACLIVRDFGRGIRKEDHERIFQRFERAISANEVSGLGLGLYIVRQILALHQGSVRVESEIGQGATFIVTLPLAASAPRSADELSRAEPA